MVEKTEENARAVAEAVFTYYHKDETESRTYSFTDWSGVTDEEYSLLLHPVTAFLTDFRNDPAAEKWARGLAATDERFAAFFDSVSFRGSVLSFWREYASTRWILRYEDTQELARQGKIGETPESWPRKAGDGFYIGPHRVSNPGVEAFSVAEDYGIAGVGGIRSAGDAATRTGKTRMRIDVDVLYPDVPAVNREFRPLLAYLRFCPLVPIEGQFIRDTVLREFVDDDSFRKVAALLEAKEASDEELEGLLRDAGWPVDADQDAVALVKEKIRGNADFDKALESIRNDARAMGVDPTAPARRVDFALCLLQAVQITTVSEAPDAIRARFSFLLFNDLSVSRRGIRFLDDRGIPTEDITRSGWLRRAIEIAHLTEGAEGYVPEYPEAAGPGDFQIRYRHPMEEEASRILAASEDVIPASVEVTAENKVAPVPVVGEDIPSGQYLGRKNAMVRVVLNCSAEGLAQVSKMKNACSELARGPVKLFRNDSVVLTCPPAALVGASRFLVSGMASTPWPDVPGRFQVVLSLLEAPRTPEEQESLYYLGRTFSREMAKSFWDYAWGLYSAYVAGEIPKNDRRFAEWKNLEALLFGPKQDGVGGILNMDFLVGTARTPGSPLFEHFLGLVADGKVGVPEDRGDMITFPDTSSAALSGGSKTFRGTFFEDAAAPDAIFIPGGKTANLYDLGNGLKDETAPDAILWKFFTSDCYGYSTLEFGKRKAKPAADRREFLSPLLARGGAPRLSRETWDKLLETLVAQPYEGKFLSSNPGTVEDRYALPNPRQSKWHYGYLPGDEQWKTSWTVEEFHEYTAYATGDDEKDLVPPFDPDGTLLSLRYLRTALDLQVEQFPSWRPGTEAAQRNVYVPVGIREPGKPTRRFSAYPDLSLPTYRELFTVGEKLSPVWTLFAPTYQSLGKAPPLSDQSAFADPEQMQRLVAVDPDSFVAPWFYFEAGSAKEGLLETKKRLLADHVFASLVEDTVTTRWSLSDRPGPDEDDVPAIEEMIREQLRASRDDRQKVEALKDGKKRRLFVMASDRSVPIGVLTRSENGNDWRFERIATKGTGRMIVDLSGTVLDDGQSLTRTRAIADIAIQSVPDDKLTVARCFPAFRFRIVDFDSGLCTDDFYDYRSVRSISVTHDKVDAALLEIELSNVSGSLDSDSFLTKAEVRKLGLLPDDEVGDPNDDTAGKIMRTWKLREGTCVELRMGYSPNIEELKTEFTGRIVQVQPGDVVSIVAQGYTTELLNDVTLLVKDAGLGDVIRKVFQAADGEDVTKKPEEIPFGQKRNGTPHLGTRIDGMSQEKQDEMKVYLDRVLGENRVKVTGGDVFLQSPQTFPLSDAHGPVGKTLAVPSVADYTFADLYTDKPDRLRNIRPLEFKGGKKDWVVPYQPGMEVIRTLCDFMPGWVAAVVPHDHLGTLYVGPVDGLYHATSRTQEELVTWLKLRPLLVQQLSRATRHLGDFVDEWERVRKEYDGRKDDGESLEGLLAPYRESAGSFVDSAIAAFFGVDLVTRDEYPAGAGLVVPAVSRILIRGGHPVTAVWVNSLRDVIEQEVGEGGAVSADDPWWKVMGLAKQPWDVANGITSRLVEMSIPAPRFRDPPSGDMFLARSDYTYRKADPEIRAALIKEDYRPEQAEIVAERLWGKLSTFDFVMKLAFSFRGYVRALVKYLETHKEVAGAFAAEQKKAAWRFRPPGVAPFRRYHHTMSRFDLIENNIVVSMAEMANAILLRYPKDVDDWDDVADRGGTEDQILKVDFAAEEWTDFGGPKGIPFHPKLKLEEKKLQVTMEPNARSPQEAARVFFSRMADAIRPMYRGNLVMWGRSVRPYDVVMIGDSYNEMRGPVEVERVVHHFTAETGWTTTVVPHAVVHVNNGPSLFMTSVLQRFLQGLETGLDVAGWALLVLSVLSLGTTALAAGAARAGASTVAKAGAKAMTKEVVKEGAEVAKKTVRKKMGEKLTKSQIVSKLRGLNLVDFAKAVELRTGIGLKANASGLFVGALDIFALSPFVNTIGDFVALGASVPEIPGIVSVTPLLCQGRPLVAGLSSEDRDYVTLLEQYYRGVGDVFEGVWDSIAGEIHEESKNDAVVPSRRER